jgi:predicted Zn-dependent protease
MAYVAAGKPEEGDAQLAQWLKEVPGDTQVRLFAGESAMKRARYKDAIAHYEMVQQKQPDSVLVLNNLAWAYSQTKDRRALETAERAHKLAPDNASVTDTLGTLLIEGGDTKRGIALLEKAAQAAPNIAEIHYHLAQGWIKAGEKSKARGALERALSINEKFSDHEEALSLLKKLRE